MRWVGIPFAWGGESFDGADCVGLVRLYLRETGIELPPEDGPRDARAWRDTARDRMARFLAAHCERVVHPQRGDIVLIRLPGQLAHVGVMVDSLRMLHTRADGCSSICRVYPGSIFYRPR
jgi:cell wall-associated NlpC family hydrolase